MERKFNSSFWYAFKVIILKTYHYLFSEDIKGDVINGYGLYSKPLLISYSRSGTNWLRYFVETVSGKPTPGERRLVYGRRFVIDRAHAGYRKSDRYDKVLFLVRNYKECLVRHHGLEIIKEYESISAYLDSEKISQPAQWYLWNLEAYERFEGSKILVYYEDLITEPSKYLKEIGEFIGLPSQEVDKFINNLDVHKERSLMAYTRFGHKSETKGDPNSLQHHSNSLSPEELREFDEYFEKNNSELFKKYLTRYTES